MTPISRAPSARRRRTARPECLRRNAAIALAPILALACESTPEQQPLEVETGRRAETTHDGLVRMRGSSLQGVWVRPDDVDWPYTRLLIGDILMAYKRPPRRNARATRGTGQGNFPLTEEQATQLEDMMRASLVEEIETSEYWSLADEPGPDVLLLVPAMLDLVVTTPPTNDPQRTTFVTSAGAVTLVLELRDSQTKEILARVADRREARQPGVGNQDLFWSNPVTNTAAVRAIFRRFARLFMARLDTAQRELEQARGAPAPE